MAICASSVCGKETDSTLKCPICLKNNMESIFCDQTCFRTSWSQHKAIHPQDDGQVYNPFPNYNYRGDLRPCYPLTPKRSVPKHIKLPDYAKDGKPVSELKNDRLGKITILTEKEQEKIRKVGAYGREILDAVAKHVAPGITTDELDAIYIKNVLKEIVIHHL